LSYNRSYNHTRARRAAGMLLLASLFPSAASALAKDRKDPKLTKQQQGQPEQQEQPPPLPAPRHQQVPATVPQQATTSGPPSGEGPAKARDLEAAQDAPPAPQGEERRSIGEYVRSHLADVTACYEDRLSARKSLQGRLIARFDIGPDGRVISASAEGIDDRELVRCTIEAMRSWRFGRPASGGKLRVAYPFVFRSEANL
jgi:outer membrane biosynthesis protein TonB